MVEMFDRRDLGLGCRACAAAAGLALGLAACGGKANQSRKAIDDGAASGTGGEVDSALDGSLADAGQDGPNAAESEQSKDDSSEVGVTDGTTGIESDVALDVEADVRASPVDATDGTFAEGNFGPDATLDAAPSEPSCKAGGPGLSTCGDGQEDCCASLDLPGGTYDRAYMSDQDGGAKDTAIAATVSGFRLDKEEVTVGRFRAFVSAWGAGWLPPAGSGKHSHLNGGQGLVNPMPFGYETGWNAADNANVAPTSSNLACGGGAEATWTTSPGARDALPINCVNWYEAYAFCIWDGGFLPSEAEWEYAAAGGSQQREYPWGAVDPGASNEYAIYACHFPTGSMNCAGANIGPVGTTTSGASRWGQLDLAGNVSEWDLDWAAAYPSPCTDCGNLTAATLRVFRGGDFESLESNIAPPYRNSGLPSLRSVGLGMRCARTP